MSFLHVRIQTVVGRVQAHFPLTVLGFSCCLLSSSPPTTPSHTACWLRGALSPHCSYWSRMNLQHLPQKGEPSKNKPSRSASQTRGQAGPKSISLGKAPLSVTSHSLQQPGPASTGEKVLSNTIEQKGFLRKNQVKRMCRHQ